MTSSPFDRSTPRWWAARVALGTAAAAVVGATLSGAAGLLVGVAAVGATLSERLLGLVQQRSRRLRQQLLDRLEGLRTELADEAVAARSHTPVAYVRLLDEYTAAAAPGSQSLQRLREALADVDDRLARTRTQRAGWATDGRPELIGGLAAQSADGIALKRYGDPINLPGWLPGRRPRAALLRIGRVLDDIRLLNSAEIEAAVLMITFWARALLLVLAPALGVLSAAPPPDFGSFGPRDAPWALATAWALGTALAAPRLARLVMEESRAGLQTRRVLLAVELPLAIGLALTCPGWACVAFAAGWTNWWQRLGRSPQIPDFSWTRLGVWIVVTAASQVVGLALAPGDLVWWQAALEVALTFLAIAIIGGSYGAMLPVSTAVGVRVLFSGGRQQRRADVDAANLIEDIVKAMLRAADELATLPDRGPADASAENVLRRAVDGMLPTPAARKRDGPASLGDVVTGALVEGGHDMWHEDPRSEAEQERARREERFLPVVVFGPVFEDETAGLVVAKETARILHELLVNCIVEARVHGMRRVQTIVCRHEDRVEIRVANRPRPGDLRKGSGRGARDIRVLAARLPGAGELFRGLTDRTFLGEEGTARLWGVSFSFTVSDTAANGQGPTTRHRL